ncbi:hypothetical protein CB1_001402001 [Camelus ferus]|nr:hypothetical protein CB1_001402001 [Camelus ferus]
MLKSSARKPMTGTVGNRKTLKKTDYFSKSTSSLFHVAMAEPQPASGGLTDEAALSCCSDPDPSTKVGAEPNSAGSGLCVA